MDRSQFAQPKKVTTLKSHLVRGAWIEVIFPDVLYPLVVSHLVRGAWIEVGGRFAAIMPAIVAPRERCVDRSKSDKRCGVVNIRRTS